MRKMSEKMYGEAKIKKLLKQYGAEDKEIENFIKDLNAPEQAPTDKFEVDGMEVKEAPKQDVRGQTVDSLLQRDKE